MSGNDKGRPSSLNSAIKPTNLAVSIASHSNDIPLQLSPVEKKRHQRTKSNPTDNGSLVSGPSQQNDILDLQQIFRGATDSASLGGISPGRQTLPLVVNQKPSSQRTILSMNSDISSVDGHSRPGYEYTENTNILPSPEKSEESSHHREIISTSASDISNGSQQTPFLPSLANNSTGITENNNDSNTNPIMLGLEQLERQQAESEARKLGAQRSQQESSMDRQPPSLIHVSTDHDAPPSTITSPTTVYANDESQVEQQRNQNFLDNIAALDRNASKASSTLERLMSPFVMKKRTGSFNKSTPSNSVHNRGNDGNAYNNGKTYDEQEDNLDLQPLVYGYLHKLNKKGVWQKRYFETDGKYLTYFKSKKRIKLLATLDLTKIGEICMDTDDETKCTFKLHIRDRPYILKAENSGICEDWVINLNRVREARVKLGGMDLVEPTFQPQPQDYDSKHDRKRSESSTELVSRVSVKASRKRSQACYGIDNYMQDIETTDENKGGEPDSPSSGSGVFDKWNKRQNHFQRMKSRIARFVRWMRIARCNTANIRHEVVTRTTHSGVSARNQRRMFQYPNPSYEDGTNSTESQLSSTRPYESGQESAVSGLSNNQNQATCDTSAATSSSPQPDYYEDDEKRDPVFA